MTASPFTTGYHPESHPKTFQLRTIAALPEPAGRPTHGLLSRRSTDRISTPPLANFAQLSMFRFDGVIKHHVDLLVNTVLIYFVDFILSC
ncbi:hypothetical protein F9V24_11665 [Escherichia coli]|nr:hypothetical protein [Escherichia coli]